MGCFPSSGDRYEAGKYELCNWEDLKLSDTLQDLLAKQ